MGIFDSIKKKLSSKEEDRSREQNALSRQASPRRTASNIKSSEYFQTVKIHKFHK